MLALLALAGQGLPRVARGEEEVRIALVANQARVDLAGRDLAIYDGETGDRLVAWADTVAIQVVARRGGLRLLPGLTSPPAAAAGSASSSRPRFAAAAASRLPDAARPRAAAERGRPPGLDGGRELPPRRRVLIEARGGIRVGSGVYLGRIELAPEAGGSTVLAINRLPLETYLLGIVGSEMNPEWPLEALKAQAVAARTYALQRRMMMRAANRPYDLESSVLSQVYKGADRIRPAVIQAVKETRGEVMSYHHGLVEALFHSTCGGRTESARAAFGRAVPYLVPEPCPWCRDSSLRRWHLDLPLDELSSMLEAAQLTRAKLKSLERGEGQALVSVRDKRGGRAVDPRAVRQAVGYGVLYSEHFTARTKGRTVRFDGSGFGHGVGMCQWGARGMALAGKNHVEILEHYYKGVRVQRIYD